MVIWHDAKIICGVEITLSPEILRNIHSFDSDFKYEGNISSRSSYKIYKKIPMWLLEKYPALKIYQSIPYYDCDYNKCRYYLGFKLSCSKVSAKTSFSDFLTLLNNANVGEFRKVFSILCPDESEKYPEIVIQAVPYVW